MSWETFSSNFVGLYNYWIVIFLMMTGFYIVIARQNLVKTVIGLNIFQTSVFLLYITMGKVNGGTAPIVPPAIVALHHSDHGGSHASTDLDAAHPPVDHAVDALSHSIEHAAENAATIVEPIIYSNPMPSVLMLTAIVVGIATTSLALALIVRIREDYGTTEEDRILELDRNS